MEMVFTHILHSVSEYFFCLREGSLKLITTKLHSSITFSDIVTILY